MTCPCPYNDLGVTPGQSVQPKGVSVKDYGNLGFDLGVKLGVIAGAAFGIMMEYSFWYIVPFVIPAAGILGGLVLGTAFTVGAMATNALGLGHGKSLEHAPGKHTEPLKTVDHERVDRSKFRKSYEKPQPKVTAVKHENPNVPKFGEYRGP